MKTKHIDVTISIASFNTKTLLKRCIASIQKYIPKELSYEIIVVDNGSSDGSAEMVKRTFPDVVLIANKTNHFFSIANDQALHIAKGKFFLILNSDAYFNDGSIVKMKNFMEANAKEVGACEGLELYENGKVLNTGSKHTTPLLDFYELSFIGKRFKDAKRISEYRMDSFNRNDTYEVDVACDAFMMVPTELLRDIGGYDERLKLYYTENDLSMRIQQQGFKVMHFGNARVIHTVSVSANKLKWKKLKLYYQDLLQYYWKHDFKVSGLGLFCLLKIELIFLRFFRSHMFDA